MPSFILSAGCLVSELVVDVVDCHAAGEAVVGAAFGSGYVFYPSFVEKIELVTMAGSYSCEIDGAFIDITVRITVVCHADIPCDIYVRKDHVGGGDGSHDRECYK